MRKSGLVALLLAVLLAHAAAQQPPRPAAPDPKPPESPIRFALRPIDFRLDSSETLERRAPETMAGGLAIFDYNNDGKLDIFFANGADITTLKKSAPKYRNRLFENDGKGNFSDVTDKAGLAGFGFDNGVAVADYDNDGYADIFVGGVYRNTLYHNNGDGTFKDVTSKAGLDKPDPKFGPLWSVGGVWFDANNDGLLDLFVVNYMKWDIKNEPLCQGEGHRDYCHPKMYEPTPNQLFLNNGDGTFKDVSVESGIRAYPGKGMGGAVADVDLDGDLDVFVSNDKLVNFFFRNNGAGKFEEVGFDLNVALREDGIFISGMGVDFRDFDNDGLPDLCLVALDNETFPVYRNIGKRGFTEVTRTSDMTRLSATMAGYSPTFGDFDNDLWKDIFVSRGHVQSLLYASRMMIEQPNTVFRNLEGKKFSALTGEAGFTAAAPSRHRGSALGDLNGDGKLDIVVSAISAPAEIWINESPGNHWLDIKLQGTKSNRDGIGALIKVVTKSGAQWNHMSTAAGYASASTAPVHFGLGPDESVDLIEIRWPSGAVQQLRNVAADRILTVQEPK